MKAQHIIANMVGFRRWAELVNVSEPELELAKSLFDNQDRVHPMIGKCISSARKGITIQLLTLIPDLKSSS
jgi:hypothetical protein